MRVLEILRGKLLIVYSVPEGIVFRRKYPLMLIESRLSDMTLFETAYLGILRFARCITTMLARIKERATDKRVLSFGLRLYT